jgi:hypothetical protein
MIIRTSLVGLVIAAAVGIAACGSDNGISQSESQQIQDHAAQVRKDAQKSADEVRAGTKDAEQAAEEIQDDATELGNETIDAAKDADMPDEAKKALEDAQKQMNAANDK